MKKCTQCKRRPRQKGRTKCRQCRHKNYVAADPVRVSFQNMRARAKERGKEFTITLAYFRRFCYKYDYIQGKGRTSDSYTVDRIREELGYVPGNIQVKPNGENVKKYLSYRWETKQAEVITNRTTKDFLF